MSEKVVLPKFRVPGRRPHWLVLVLWGVGALVVIQVAVLAALTLRHRDEAAAAPAAPPSGATAAAPAAAPAAVASTAPASPKAVGGQVLTGGMPAPTAPLPEPAVARRPVRHRSHHAAPARALARGGRSDAPSKPDALDELLKKFK